MLSALVLHHHCESTQSAGTYHSNTSSVICNWSVLKLVSDLRDPLCTRSSSWRALVKTRLAFNNYLNHMFALRSLLNSNNSHDTIFGKRSYPVRSVCLHTWTWIWSAGLIMTMHTVFIISWPLFWQCRSALTFPSMLVLESKKATNWPSKALNILYAILA